HRAPPARVARAVAVVPHHEVLPLRDRHRPLGEVVTALGFYVRLVELLAVDVDVALDLLPGVARKADQALDEDAARAADLRRTRRRVEDDDVAPVRAPEPVAEPAREHAAGEAR